MNPRDYIEAVALELGRIRGRGLVLSPADAQLALAWHAARVPLQTVLGEIRRGERLRSKSMAIRGVAELGLSLQTIAPALEARLRVPPRQTPESGGISSELRRAARAPGLPARDAWEDLAERADDLLAEGPDAYWSAAIAALLRSLREMPRSETRKAAAALRARLAPRPPGLSLSRYKRSLQLMLLSACSAELALPPREFLL